MPHYCTPVSYQIDYMVTPVFHNKIAPDVMFSVYTLDTVIWHL